jgi:type VI secretion system protein ImpM
MRCGLFGKLSAKRDFIALATPRAFLEIWEPWVQASLSASRHQLGEGWQQAFLTTPVWRFWLGAAICGTTVTGAIMPSLDGVGRYYPLTLHAVADAAAPIVPPDSDAQEEWFGMAENFLFSTLDRETVFEDVSAALDRLATPRTQPIPEASSSIVMIGNGLAGMISPADGFSTSLSSLRAANPDTYAAASFWWTAGGGDFPPLALTCRGLPDPFRYSTFLSGNLKETATNG